MKRTKIAMVARAKKIESYIESNNLIDYVHLTGYINEVELIEKYKECIMFILPSEEESQGIVLLEAMACSKPVIASNVGGIPYHIENRKTGIVFECGDRTRAAEKVVTLLQNRELRAKMGRAAREEVRRFTWDKVADQTAELYRKILSMSRQKNLESK